MRFVDEATIEVAAGKGGDGCLSFRRERYIAKGGPDGGNGGDGGSVYLRADAQLHTLLDYRYRRQHQARNGSPGAGKLRHGKNGEDLLLPVPTNLSALDADSGELIGRLQQDGELLLVAKGGAGGAGNNCFKSSTNRTPRKFTSGKSGEGRRLLLSLELLAEVALVGLPNAGKSSLLRRLSNARPEVGAYPFTTKFPQLGVLETELGSLLIVDIPGLIAGASTGVGMGHKFLKHITRTRLLLHLIDSSDGNYAEQIATVEAELRLYKPELLQLPRWLLFNKIDCLSSAELAELRSYPSSAPCLLLSALEGDGLLELKTQLTGYLRQITPDLV